MRCGPKRTGPAMLALVAAMCATAHTDAPEGTQDMQAAQGSHLVFVGTYTNGDSEGIYSYSMDAETGALSPLGVTGGIENPSFLAIHPDGRHLYSTQETGGTGGVFAYQIDTGTGELTYLSDEPSNGAAPCHLTVDRTGRWVLAANYSSGTVCVLPIAKDGGVGPASHVVQHEGSSIDPNRQKGPHAHSITLDAAGRYAFAADLGLDKVMIYRLDLEAGRLVPAETASADVAPGSGPRHFAFHPDGRHAYVINELGNTVTAFTYDAASGGLAEIQMVSTLPEGFEGESYCADIHVAPSGRFLYGSNRGHESIVIYAIDDQTGRLTLVGHEPTGGEWPRNFAIDPSGRFLLAANQHTDTIVIFEIDGETGKLAPTGHVTSVPAPACIVIVP